MRSSRTMILNSPLCVWSMGNNDAAYNIGGLSAAHALQKQISPMSLTRIPGSAPARGRSHMARFETQALSAIAAGLLLLLPVPPLQAQVQTAGTLYVDLRATHP